MDSDDQKAIMRHVAPEIDPSEIMDDYVDDGKSGITASEYFEQNPEPVLFALRTVNLNVFTMNLFGYPHILPTPEQKDKALAGLKEFLDTNIGKLSTLISEREKSGSRKRPSK